MTRKRTRSIKTGAAWAALLALLTGLAACNSAEQSVDSGQNQQSNLQLDDDRGPKVQVAEFDGFTLRANAGLADTLPDAMARQYNIEKQAGLVLINLVVLENRQNPQPTPVAAEVRVQRESLSGHVDTVDMRAAEANGHVSYMGTVDARSQRVLQLVIEVLPEGTDQWLRMNFEARLEGVGIAARSHD